MTQTGRTMKELDMFALNAFQNTYATHAAPGLHAADLGPSVQPSRRVWLQAVTLGDGVTASVDDGSGLHLRVAQGAVWLTQEGLDRDVVLAQGSTWQADGGRVVVEALGPATVERWMDAPVGQAPGRAAVQRQVAPVLRLGRTLAAGLRRLWLRSQLGQAPQA